MNGDIEIVVFNDKSWVRFFEYEKLEKEDNEIIHFLQEQILKLEEVNNQLKEKIKILENKNFETCPYRSTDMSCDYCDYRDRNLKYEVEENDK